MPKKLFGSVGTVVEDPVPLLAPVAIELAGAQEVAGIDGRTVVRFSPLEFLDLLARIYHARLRCNRNRPERLPRSQEAD